MSKSFKLISIIFLSFFSSIPLASASDPLQDPFYTQGQEVLNAPPITNCSSASGEVVHEMKGVYE